MSTKRRVAAAASPEMRTRGKRRKVTVSRRVLAPRVPTYMMELPAMRRTQSVLGQSAHYCAAPCVTLNIIRLHSILAQIANAPGYPLG